MKSIAEAINRYDAGRQRRRAPGYPPLHGKTKNLTPGNVIGVLAAMLLLMVVAITYGFLTLGFSMLHEDWCLCVMLRLA